MKKSYYYLDEESQQIGPLSMEKLLKMRQAGIITDKTLVWTEGLEKWVPLSTLLPTADGGRRKKGQTASKTGEKENLHDLKERIKKAGDSGCKKQLALIGAGLLIPLLCGGVFAFSSLGERTLNKITQEEAFAELQKLGVVSSVLDIEGERGQDALDRAAEQGNCKVALLLVAGGTPVNSTDALKIACKKGYVDIVKLLLAAPNIRISSYDLLDAVKGGNAEIVKLLLSASGVDVNEKYSEGTLLYYAVKGGKVEIVKLLLAEPDIDVNKRGYDVGTPLYKAVEEGNAEMVKLLLAAPDIDVNESVYDSKFDYFLTPLIGASKRGDVEVVKLLLTAPGMDIEWQGPQALMAASGAHQEEIKNLLRQAGVKE